MLSLLRHLIGLFIRHLLTILVGAMAEVAKAHQPPKPV